MPQVVYLAYAMPVQNTPSGLADHTYVDVGGQAFGCHGRSSGGSVIGAGAGDLDAGLCLAGAGGEAGIDYMKTGVCHQIANRILLPSGLTTVAARGARWSIRVYGSYGRQGTAYYSPVHNPWPELLACSYWHTKQACGVA